MNTEQDTTEVEVTTEPQKHEDVSSGVSNYQTQGNFFSANFPGAGQGQWSTGN